MYGSDAPTVRKLAIKVLSQTASSSACERNWSTFALIHTKQRNRLSYSRLEKMVYCYYNMRLALRDKKAEEDRVDEYDPLDIYDAAIGDDDVEENQLYQWIRPLHLDDDAGNPDPDIAAQARQEGINVDRVLNEEVSPTTSLNELMQPRSTHRTEPVPTNPSRSGNSSTRSGTIGRAHV